MYIDAFHVHTVPVTSTFFTKGFRTRLLCTVIERADCTPCLSQPTRSPGKSNQLNQVRWDQLTHVEFMVNGSRCTIYTAFYEATPVVVKVMRKDVQDKDIVRQVRGKLCLCWLGDFVGPGAPRLVYGSQPHG